MSPLHCHRARISHVKNIILVLIFFALSFASVGAQQPPPASAVSQDSDTWVKVAPAGGGFTVLMPSKASEQVNPVEGRPDVENHLVTLETELAGYVVSYVQFPDDVTDPVAIKEMLDRGREGGIKSSGGTLKSESEIKLNGYSGREWKMEIPGGVVATARAYWVRRRLYQAVFITAPKVGESPEIVKLRQEAGRKFFDSFALSEVKEVK